MRRKIRFRLSTMNVESFSINEEPVSLVSLLMAEHAASFLSVVLAFDHALKATFDRRRVERYDLHDFAQRAVELLADAHEHLERDKLVFRELGERIGADADLAGKFGLVPASVDELFEKTVVGNKQTAPPCGIRSHYTRISAKSKENFANADI